LGSAILFEEFSGPLGVEFNEAFDLNGEKGSAGATFTVTRGPLDVFKLGDLT